MSRRLPVKGKFFSLLTVSFPREEGALGNSVQSTAVTSLPVRKIQHVTRKCHTCSRHPDGAIWTHQCQKGHICDPSLTFNLDSESRLLRSFHCQNKIRENSSESSSHVTAIPQESLVVDSHGKIRIRGASIQGTQ